MAKNILFLVHGMGWNLDADAGDAAWYVAVERALREAWALFPSLSARAFDAYIELAPLSYDGVFRSYLAELSGEAERVRKVLGDSEYAKVASVIAGADADEESFFWANIVDVLLYRFGGDLFRNVHATLGRQIAEHVRKAWSSSASGAPLFSVLSHSLGTATVHGALNRLGGGRIAGSAALKLGGNFSLHCYMTLANVSRVLFRGTGAIYDQTIIRPRFAGARYVRRFLNVRHIADPIPAPMCFQPRGWGPGYSDILVRHVRSANVHAFTHYLANPRVSGALFRALLPAVLLSQAEIDEVAADYRDVDIDAEDKRRQVEQVVEDIALSLQRSFANDQDVLCGSAEWLAKLIRLTWQDRQRLASALEAI